MPDEGKDTTFPSQFGRYTLVQRLATGGMAEVFKAKILSGHGFEKLLVIKRILPNLAADKTFVSMFIDEAKLTAQLIHPKIVQVTILARSTPVLHCPGIRGRLRWLGLAPGGLAEAGSPAGLPSACSSPWRFSTRLIMRTTQRRRGQAHAPGSSRHFSLQRVHRPTPVT